MSRFVNPGSALTQADLKEFTAAFRFPVRTILSFEFLLVLLICVGAYKKNATFAWMFPIDATLILGGLCGLGILKYLMANGLQRRLVTPIALYLLFCLWAVGSIAWTRAIDASPLVGWLSRIAVINGIIFAGTLVVVAQSRVRTIRFLAALAIVSLVLGVDYVLQARAMAYMAKFDDIQYNLNGEIVALGFTVFFGFMLYMKMFTPRWTLCVAAMCILFYSSLIIGSRQGFLAALVQITVILSATVYLKRRSLHMHRGSVPALVLLVFSVLGLLLALQAGLESRLLTRLAGLSEYISGDQGADHSAGMRVRFMTAAVDYWSDSLFSMILGNGLFSYSTMFKGSYFLGAHPHNLVLNIISELGLIGLALYLGFLGSVVLGRGLNLVGVSPLNGILIGMALGELFRAMVDTRIESSGTFLMAMCLLPALRAPLYAAGRAAVARHREPATTALSRPA